MPNIREYNATAGVALQPSDRGAEAFQLEGRHIRAEYTDLGNTLGRTISTVGGQIGQQLDAHETQTEISQGAPTLAGITDGMVQNWNKVAKDSDPNDTSVAQKFRETGIEPILQEWLGHFNTKGGQAWAQNQAMALRQHMYEKQAADMSYRAGQATVNNLDQMANSYANTVRTDPSSLDLTLGVIDNSVRAQVENMPNLSADQAVHIQTELTQKYKSQATYSGFLGMIQGNPNDPQNKGNPLAARAELQSGRYGMYLTEGQRADLENRIEGQIKAQAADAKHAQADAERQVDIASDAARNSYMQKLVVGKDGGYQIPAGFAVNVMKDPRLNTSDRSSLMALSQRYADIGVEQKAVHPKEDDPETYAKYSRILGSSTDTVDPRQVMADYTAGKLTTSTFKKLTDAAYDQDPQTGAQKYDKALVSAGIAKAQAQISNGNIGFMSPAETAASKKFALDVRQQLATGNPADLLNPKSPTYLFSPENVQRYIPTKGQNAQSILNPQPAASKPSAEQPKRTPLDEIFSRSPIPIKGGVT